MWNSRATTAHSCCHDKKIRHESALTCILCPCNNLTSYISCVLHQVAATQARHYVFAHAGLPGQNCEMGAVDSVFEAIARRCPHNVPDCWPTDANERQRLVVCTRGFFGLDWAYSVDCHVNDHRQRRTTPAQSARYRDATIITIPDGHASSIGAKISTFLSSAGGASDLAFGGEALCPHCADGISQTMCEWRLLPHSAENAPDRLFFKSAEVFRGAPGERPAPSLKLTLAAEYSLVGVSYHFAVGGSSTRNHFTTQFRANGTWFKYDCLAGGSVPSSQDFDSSWHSSSIHMLAYLKTSMCVQASAAPSNSADMSPPDSPCGVQRDHFIVPSPPDSPCGVRRDHEPHQR